MSVTAPRTYRFAPLDRSGWLVGLTGTQVVALACGLLATLVSGRVGAPLLATVTVAVAGAAVALAPVGGRPACEWVPLAARHSARRATGRDRWLAPVPLVRGVRSELERQPPLPPFLRGLSLLDAGVLAWQGTSAPLGVVRDSRCGTLSATLRVGGREFSLRDRADQEHLVGAWGDVLGGFCTGRGAVVAVRVTESTAPVVTATAHRHPDSGATASANVDAAAAYRALLAGVAPAVSRHEVLLTITVDRRRARRAGVGDEAAVSTLAEELRLAAGRLHAAGLVAGLPLSAAEVAERIRLRCDPTASRALAARAQTLGQLAGVVTTANCGPLAAAGAWRHLRLDGTLHRTYWVAEWPRLDVGPNWLEPLLCYSGGTRTVTVDFAPVSPVQARHRAARDATRLSADETHRARAGFRTGAYHHRMAEAVAEREAELAAGYQELAFAGFVTVSAPTEAELGRVGDECEQAAAQAALELRALDGRHDAGFVSALPVGRTLARRERW